MPADTKEQREAREKERLAWIGRKKVLTSMAKSAARTRRIEQKKEAQHRAAITYRGQSYNRYWSARPHGGIRARSIIIDTPAGRVRYWIPY